jgi:hypothetical protein
MPRYEDDDVTFDTPDDWIDRSVVAHIGALDTSGASTNFMVSREPMRDDDTLQSYRDRQMIELAQQLDEFELLESKDTVLGGLPATMIRYTMDSPDGLVEQTMRFVERVTPDNKRIALSIATSASVSKADASRPVIEEVLRTVRIGGGDPPAPPRVEPLPPAGPSGPVETPPLVPMPGIRRR